MSNSRSNAYPGRRPPPTQIIHNSKKIFHQDPTTEDKQKKTPIDVVCRIRPQFPNETYVPYVIKPPSLMNEIEIFETKEPVGDIYNSKKFKFTRILDQDSQQPQILDEFISKIISELFQYSLIIIILLQEKSGLIFSYGVTNSGKTFTMVGNDKNPGVLPQTMHCLFNIKQAILQGQESYSIGGRVITFDSMDNHRLSDLELSFQSYEIYNEEIYDLLHDKRTMRERNKLQIKENGVRKFIVIDATDRQITDKESIDNLLQWSLSNRQMGETILNIQSSRSHTMFKIGVRMVYRHQSIIDHERVVETSLCIVDLAGSERSKKAETQGVQLNEACNINKSLLVLGRILKMMRFNDAMSILPFRECKLTRLLSEYFTEDNNILMVVNIKLTFLDLDETLKVLKYGAMGVQINLLKSRLMDSTLSFQNRLHPIQMKNKDLDSINEENSNSSFFNNTQLTRIDCCVENIQSNVSCLLKIQEEENELQKQQIQKFRNDLQSGKITAPQKVTTDYFDRDLSANQLVSGPLLEQKLSQLSRQSIENDHEKKQSNYFSFGNKDEKKLSTIQNMFEQLNISEVNVNESNLFDPYEYIQSEEQKNLEPHNNPQFQTQDLPTDQQENEEFQISGNQHEEFQFADDIFQTKISDSSKNNTTKSTNTNSDYTNFDNFFGQLQSYMTDQSSERALFRDKVFASIKNNKFEMSKEKENDSGKLNTDINDTKDIIVIQQPLEQIEENEEVVDCRKQQKKQKAKINSKKEKLKKK